MRLPYSAHLSPGGDAYRIVFVPLWTVGPELWLNASVPSSRYQLSPFDIGFQSGLSTTVPRVSATALAIVNRLL